MKHSQNWYQLEHRRPIGSNRQRPTIERLDASKTTTYEREVED